MWGHLSSLGQNVAQITKAVGAQILEATADEERLDAADFSDGDTAECTTQEASSILVRKVQRLQDKLSRTRDEIERLNDIRTRATESVSKSLRNKDEEIAELRKLLDEAHSLVSETLSPRESTPDADLGSDAHVSTPVIHQKIKASEHVSMLTRKFHEEKRSHIAALHEIKSENAKFKGRVHLLESQLAARESTSAGLDQQLSDQTTLISELQKQLHQQSEDLEAHNMVIARLRSESAQIPQASANDEVESLQKTIDKQATAISHLESTHLDLEATISELRAELDRLKSNSSDSIQEGVTANSEHERSMKSAQDNLVELQSQLESERAALQAALKVADDLRASSKPSPDAAVLQEQIAQLSADLTSAQGTIAELQMTKPEPSQSASGDSDYVPRLELTQLRDKARAQLRQFAQKCKSLEKQNTELRAQITAPSYPDKSLSIETLEQNLSLLQKFVDELRQELGMDQSSPSLNDLKATIISTIQSAHSIPSRAESSKDSELLGDLKELLQLERMDPALVISKVRALAEETQSAIAHSSSMTQAYEQAQDSIEALTAVKADMKKEIDNLMLKISELQAQCRSAFAEEKSLLSQNTDLKTQIETLQNRISDTTRQQGQKHSSSISRITSLEKEIQFLQKEIGNKDAVIRELTSQLENKTKRLVEIESVRDTWLEQAQRDRETLIAESEGLRHDLSTTSAEYESRIGTLQDQIRKERVLAHQVQLDLQASKDLVSDYAALEIQLGAKTDECINLSDALDNLQVVLDQLQIERDSKLSEAEARLQASLDAAEEGRLALQELIQVTRSLKESEAAVVQLEAKLGSSRKYALQIESDNAALRHAMQQTMDRIRTFSSDENLVDRRIVNKLLVTYLEKKASADVINLMIKMLGFTDEQRRLVLESQRPKGFISSLSSFIPTPYSAEDDEIEDGSPEQESQKNLADLWVNFLLKETGSGSRRNSAVSVHIQDQGLGSMRSPPSTRRSPFRSPSGSISDAPLRGLGNRESPRSPNPKPSEPNREIPRSPNPILSEPNSTSTS